MEDLFKFNLNNNLLSKDEYLKVFCKIALILRPDLESSIKVFEKKFIYCHHI